MNPREMTSDFANEALRPKARRVFERNCSKDNKCKGKGKNGQRTQESSTGGQWQSTSQKQNAAGNRQPLPQPKEVGKARAKAGVEGRPKARGLGTLRGCAPAKDE